MGCIGGVSNNSDSFFLYEFNLVKILLRYAAKNYRAVVKMRLDEGKVKCF